MPLSSSSPLPAELSALLQPASVAVIGASGDAMRIGGRPIAYMRAYGYKGAILPVNPKYDTVQGLPAFATIADLPVAPDVAIVAVPSAAAEAAVEALAARGTRAAVIFTAGFSETGATGAAHEARVLAAARAHGMRLLGPNCLGLFNLRCGFYGTFTSSFERIAPLEGAIGIASQSGAYGTHLYGIARDRGLGVSCCVTTGNECDLNIGDIISWMAQDDATQVIAVYSEGIRDGEGFLAALDLARANRKPVVVMKVGRSAVGRAAAQTHTASITGDDVVFDAVLSEHGAVRARTTEELLDIAYLALRRIHPAGNTLGVLTVSGGAGVLIADAAEAAGLPMPEMPQAAQTALRAVLPYCAPQNPVDCTAHVLNDMSLAGRFAESLVRDGGYRSILGFFTHVGAGSLGPKLRQELRTVRAAYPDRLFVLSILANAEEIRAFEDDGFSVFADPSRAVGAIHAMGRLGDAFTAPPPSPLPAVPAVAYSGHAAAPAAHRIMLPATTPSEAEAKRMLAQAGIPAPPERACATPDEAVAAARELGFPVVMKVMSPDILHKSEIGGVLLNVADAQGVAAGFRLLCERAGNAAPDARLEGILVAKQLFGGIECILGITRDPVFGAIAVFGLGGVFVEVLKDVVLRRCPFGEREAETMIRSIRGAPLLQGARGRPPCDIKALAAMLSRLSVFAHQAGPRLASIDLNPVFAMPEGEGAYAADAVIEMTCVETDE
jgi:acetate---CoA ligase (ADP-forming)